MTYHVAPSSPSTVALLAACLLGACSTTRVTTDVAPDFVVPAGATYVWGNAGSRPTPLVGENDPAVRNDSLRNRIHRAIDAELTRKGFRLTDSASANFLVHYHLGVQRKVITVQEETPQPSHVVPVIRCGDRECYSDWVWVDEWPPEVSYRDVPYTEGTLMIDIERASDGKLAWRGVGQDEVDRSDAREKAIRKAVKKVLSKLPASQLAP